MKPEEHEKWIEEQIRYGGLTRAEAEFALAIEVGEIDGDTVGESDADDSEESPDRS